jgi:pyrroloquinoline quinone (PQQ) biosynthesis protein C
MHSIIEPPLAREGFEAELLAAVEGFRPEDTRFYRMLASGRCPPPVLLRYARSTYLSAKLFCASIAELVEKAPDRDARLTLLENLLEEEGILLRADRGLVLRPETRHPALALRFLKACGGGEEDEDARDGDGLHATGEGRRMLAEDRWLEAVSFLLVGQELKFAYAAGCFFELLRRNGLEERDLAFFAVHVEADCAHGREALDLVLDRALTRREQEACLAAAAAGARSWFLMHGGGASDRRAA